MLRFVTLLFVSITSFANDPYPKNRSIDIQHYRFELALSDSSDSIEGKASITILMVKSTHTFHLDLASRTAGGKGMIVTGVSRAGAPVNYTHLNDRIEIVLPAAVDAGETLTLNIAYHGVPRDGLIISRNKYNDRTFFGDNWPDRGHQWLPAIDHPSDKAPVDFVIEAPEHYQVVATGQQIEETNLTNQRKRTHYRETAPVAVKVMTIGVARFATQLSGEPASVPVSTWVYPQDREAGFYDFAVAPTIFSFLQNYIGAFSYKKLAHVQSKTRFGGLENAGAIFYFENAVTGKNEREGLIAHESAHQWFGNSATENDWHHVWLSEGFATYFSALYFEHAYGKERLAKELFLDREQIIKFYARNQRPIVDTTIVDINQVLSTNTYQKASWVLHMLRHEMGDDAFQQTVREYYATYQNGNALTQDFQRIAQKHTPKQLNVFFNQWLWRGGHPQLQLIWSYDDKKKELTITCQQTQKEGPFVCALEIGLKSPEGVQPQVLQLDQRKNHFVIKTAAKPADIILDPSTKLLFEGKIAQN